MKTLLQFELRKIFSKRLTRAALLVLLLLSFLFAYSTYQNMYAFDGISEEGSGKDAVEIDKSIARTYEGLLTDEKMLQMMSDFAPKSDLQGMNAAYLYQNALQSAVFARFSDMEGNWNGLYVSDVFGEEPIYIGYTYGWLKTSQNMVPVFLTLSFVIIMVTAPVFCGEYEGVDQIILASRYGKSKCTAAKIIAANLAALSVTAVISAINFVLALLCYGKSGLGCSILFAPIEYVDNGIPLNITCAALLGYQVLLAFTCAVSVTGITLILSALCRKQITVLAASAALYMFPVILPVSENSPLFRYIVLLPVYHAQFISLMSISGHTASLYSMQQTKSGALYALLALPVAFCHLGAGAFFSRKIFAGHQVS